MTGSEFVNATSRLEQYFGKEYTELQRRIMFETLKEWTIEKYRRAVKHCIGSCKCLPKIVDLKAINFVQEPNSAKLEDVEFVECKFCNKGFVPYYKKYGDISYQFFALCSCENGQKQRANGYNLPSWNGA